jgi:lysyl-tRNA synthetase class 2
MSDTSSSNWRPSASIANLQKRGQIISQIRQFFARRNVWEVDTPSLCSSTVTDLHMQAFVTEFSCPPSGKSQNLYLQTSPEYAMKRLLCAGSGAIFQICKAFRNEDVGRNHNPEFTMLEWYRPGFDHLQLMAELNELVQMVLGCKAADKISYQQACQQFLQLDPLSASLKEVKFLGTELGYGHICAQEDNIDTLLQLLFCQHVEPKIGQNVPCFIYDFPASQAALARISPVDPRVAQRFELYYQGKELANGFHELADAGEQSQRFSHENKQRAAIGLEPVSIDEHFLEALQAGLPDCAGVAVGIDRLIMLALEENDISQVLAFSYHNA